MRLTMRATDRAAEGLRRAADVLAAARHPGVAGLLELRSIGATAELDLEVPDGVPLRSLALSPEEIAGVVATLATTVAVMGR